MGDKQKFILAAEINFARRVALGIIVRRPVKPLLQVIPGMFIFDFLKRTAEVRKYTQYYLAAINPALTAAGIVNNGGDKNEMLSRGKMDLKTWLLSKNLYSDEILQKHMIRIEFLVDHYCRLFQAQGDGYEDLIRNVYPEQSDYEAFNGRLTEIERDIDQAINDKTGEDEVVKSRLAAERQQTEETRQKDAGLFFL